MNGRIYNFSAGPSILPAEVLEKAGKEILNYRGCGMSVMEMSHRGSEFLEIFKDTKAKLKEIMGVPEGYEVLFLQGGGSLQFAMAPMNLISVSGRADYAVTGNFAELAAKEAEKYGEVNVAASSADRKHTYIPSQEELKLDPGASYFYFCSNNTIYGTEWKYVPETGSVPIVCDMSSNILSKPVDVSKYGLIFAGAQKNMAPAGLTLVIIRKDLAGHELPCTPVMMSYKTMIEKDSMYNTPPCFNIYVLGLVLDWVKALGGLEAMRRRNEEKAALLYGYLDESRLFRPAADRAARSVMNVVFNTGDAELDSRFAREAAAAGLVSVAGHRSTGGMRASIYNAMPAEGVKALVAFMKEFEAKNR